MKKHRVVKRVNTTETGKSRTNDTYLLLSSIDGVDWHSIFDFNTELLFWDKRSNKSWTLKLTNPRNEKRVTKMGKYYKEYEIIPGDAVILECVMDPLTRQKAYSIDYVDNSKTLTLGVTNGVFELYNNDEIKLLDSLVAKNNLKIYGTNKSIKFIKKKATKRRNRDIYPVSIKVDGNEENFDTKSTELIQVELVKVDEIIVNKVNIIDYYSLEGE
jgi:hypothetical protein